MWGCRRGSNDMEKLSVTSCTMQPSDLVHRGSQAEASSPAEVQLPLIEVHGHRHDWWMRTYSDNPWRGGLASTLYASRRRVACTLKLFSASAQRRRGSTHPEVDAFPSSGRGLDPEPEDGTGFTASNRPSRLHRAKQRGGQSRAQTVWT